MSDEKSKYMSKKWISSGNVVHHYISTGPNHNLTIQFDTDVIYYIAFNLKMTESPITKNTNSENDASNTDVVVWCLEEKAKNLRQCLRVWVGQRVLQ